MHEFEKNTIHPTALVHENAKMGSGNFIGPYCIIGPNVNMGDNNRVEAFCSIGTAAEKSGYMLDEPGPVGIGSGNIIREYVTINGGTDGPTMIGDNCTLLKGSHIGHDASLFDRVTLSCGVKVGGHSILHEGVNMGLNSSCHQFSILGHYAMIGMGGVVGPKAWIWPCWIYVGVPVKQLKANKVAIQRNNLTEEKITIFNKEYEDSRSAFTH